MRGNPQAASARLPARVPARPWSAWLERNKETRRRRHEERVDVIWRLKDAERRARRPRRYEMPRRLP